MTTAADLLKLSDDALTAEVGKLPAEQRTALIAEWEKLFAAAEREHAEFCKSMPPVVEMVADPAAGGDAKKTVVVPVDPDQQAEREKLLAEAVLIAKRLDRLRRIVKAAEA